MNMKKSEKTAICGMAAAVSVVLMMLNNIIPVLMYVLPIVTGFLVLFVSRLINKKWALGVFFSTSVLSLLLLTDKEAALTYTLFFGYYPLMREYIEKLPKIASWLLKLLLFNCAVVAIGFSGVYIFGVSGDEYNEFGKFTVPILLLMANIVFVLYEMIMKKYGFVFSAFIKKFEKIIK